MPENKFKVHAKNIPNTKDWANTATRVLNELLEKYNKLAEDYQNLKDELNKKNLIP